MALAEGHEISVLRLQEVMRENPVKRIDSTYFRKAYIGADRTLRSCPHSTISESSYSVLSFGAYALTNNYEYKEYGIPFLRCTNIKSGFVSFVDCLYIDEEANGLLLKSSVEPETVLLTMSGSVGSSIVALPSWEYPINSNQDIAKIKTKDVDPYYLAAFLGSRFGRFQIERLPVGSVQQHIFLWMIESMLVARLGRKAEERIGRTIRAAYAAREYGIRRLAEAEGALMVALGLTAWSPPTPLSYLTRASVAFKSGRLDAEFFAPRIRQLLDILENSGPTIGGVAPSRRRKFDPGLPGTFEYIEIGDLAGDGTTGSTSLERSAAPSRATWHVDSGDVITSTVRPKRRLSALIEDHQEGHVCSSGFVVLGPIAVRSEVLLTYLRLPIFCELMDLHTSASMYPAIAEGDLMGLPFAPPDSRTEKAICKAVADARNARRRSKALLDAAKRAVEVAIEQNEAEAMRLLRDVEG